MVVANKKRRFSWPAIKAWLLHKRYEPSAPQTEEQPSQTVSESQATAPTTNAGPLPIMFPPRPAVAATVLEGARERAGGFDAPWRSTRASGPAAPRPPSRGGNPRGSDDA